MVKILLGANVSAMSGKLGGVVYSHNRFGPYIRTKSTPVNPNTERQTTVRAIFSNLTTRFKDTLTETQRAGWDIWTKNSPMKNVFGNTYNLTAINAYVRTNSLRLLTGQAEIDDAPVSFGEANSIVINEAGITVSAAAGTISIAATTDVTGFDASVDDDTLICYAGLPRSPNVEFFNGPFRYSGAIIGDSGTPPAVPYVFTPGFTLVEGQRMTIGFKHLDEEGLVSPMGQFNTIIAA